MIKYLMENIWFYLYNCKATKILLQESSRRHLTKIDGPSCMKGEIQSIDTMFD